ncbi:MAG: hypothetical protein E6G39_20935 [Actinobacteria bacterium]|nr:MAG: hypothetical protein E6G39_20935 [Actinomycetota bacterium]
MDTRTPPLPPAYPPNQLFATNSWEQRPSRRDRGFTVAAAIAIVAIVVGCIAMVNGRDPLVVVQWDPRVAPLVAFVEEERGYSFHHPVEVQFLTAEQYRAEATHSDPLTDDDRAYYRDQARLFRALGLIGGDVDLAAEQDEISDSGTLAYYSPNTHTVYVRGVELTPSLRVTLVHELTHALQDQIFKLDLSRTKSDGEAFALRALAEGDAIRVENAYYSSLSEEEQAQVDAQTGTEIDSSKALNGDAAPILLALFGAPYDLGVPFVRLLASIDGELDRAFRSPPTSEENVFDPISFLAHDEPLKVTAPKAPTDSRRVDALGNEIGAVGWYLLIASYTEQKQAMTAVEGWGGDAMTVYERAGLLCAAMVFRGDSARDADEMYAALKNVVTSLADHAPQLGRQASDVTLTLCDPGPSASVAQIDAASIFAAPTTRSLLLGIALEDPSVSPRQADCAVDKTLEGLDEAHMLQLLGATSEDDPVVGSALGNLYSFTAACR